MENTEANSVNELSNTIDHLIVIFGTKAEIKRVGNIYDIKSNLADGITEGGQTLHCQIYSRPVKVLCALDDTISPGYQVLSLEVNKFNLSKHLSPIVLTPLQDQLKSFENKTHPLSIQYSRQSGSSAAKDSRTIILSSLNTGDDLIVLFHENAHLKIPFISDYHTFSEIERLWKYDDTCIPSYTQRVYLNVLKEESNANQGAFKHLKRTGAAKKLFPNDPNLFRVKKSLVTSTLTYVNAAEGKFARLVEADTINKIIMF